MPNKTRTNWLAVRDAIIDIGWAALGFAVFWYVIIPLCSK